MVNGASGADFPAEPTYLTFVISRDLRFFENIFTVSLLFHCHLDNDTLALAIQMVILAAVDYGTAHLVTCCAESQSK